MEEEREVVVQTVRRVCVICGKEFMGNGNGKYCCIECREKGVERNRIEARRREKEREGIQDERVCPICGKAFRIGAKNKLYCSEKCKREGAKRKREEGKKAAFKGIEGLAREWGVEDIKDPISQLNEIARRQHKSYGEIKAELLIQRMREGKV